MTRALFTIRNLLLMTIGTLAVLIIMLVGREVFLRWEQLTRIEALKEVTALGDELFTGGEKLATERHIGFSMLYMSESKQRENLLHRFEESRAETDAVLQKVLGQLEGYSYSDLHEQVAAIRSGFSELQALRPKLEAAMKRPAAKSDGELADMWFTQSSVLVRKTQLLWSDIIKDFMDVDPVVSAQMRFKNFLWIATEHTGRERSLIGRLIVQNAVPTPQEQSQLLRWQGVVDYFWNTVPIITEQSRMTKELMPYLKDAKSDYDNVYDMLQSTFLLPSAARTQPYPINGELWLELSAQSNQSLYHLKDVVLRETRRYVEMRETEVQGEIFVRALALLLTLLLCAFSFWVVIVRVLRPINTMIEALVSATQGKPVSPTLLQVRQNDEIGKLAHVLSVFQWNVEELKRSSLMLARYNEELKRSNQELDDFAYIASHDLKEPLRGLITQTSFLMEDYQDKLDVEAIRRLRRLMFLSQRMEQLISDLLYFSRLGRTELAVQETDPNEVIVEIRQMMDTFLRERNAQVNVPVPLPRIVCDKLRVTEVFRNLITNAIKYNDKPVRAVEVGFLPEVSTPHGEGKNVFYIKDNGVGIAPEFHQAIFRIFKRLKNPAVKDEEGTGSGLTFVKKIIERHKGHIWLESVPGEGTTFYFTLSENGA